MIRSLREVHYKNLMMVLDSPKTYSGVTLCTSRCSGKMMPDPPTSDTRCELANSSGLLSMKDRSRSTSWCSLDGALSMRKLSNLRIFSQCLKSRPYSSCCVILCLLSGEHRFSTMLLQIQEYAGDYISSCRACRKCSSSKRRADISQRISQSVRLAKLRRVRPTENMSEASRFDGCMSPLARLSMSSGEMQAGSFSMPFSQAVVACGQLLREATLSFPSSLRKMLFGLMSPRWSPASRASCSALMSLKSRFQISVSWKRVFLPLRWWISPLIRQQYFSQKTYFPLEVPPQCPSSSKYR